MTGWVGCADVGMAVLSPVSQSRRFHPILGRLEAVHDFGSGGPATEEDALAIGSGT